VQDPFGVLTNIPLVWLALAAPLGWRKRSDQERGALRFFVTAAWLLFGMCALTLMFLHTADVRYEVDFLPALVLLAVVGILGIERALADQPAQRRLARWGWGGLLGFSVVFNVLVTSGTTRMWLFDGDDAYCRGPGAGSYPGIRECSPIEPDEPMGASIWGSLCGKLASRKKPSVSTSTRCGSIRLC